VKEDAYFALEGRDQFLFCEDHNGAMVTPKQEQAARVDLRS
jgi:hypothetical protein